MMSQAEYEYRVGLPLDEKLFLTQTRIQEFIEWCGENGRTPTINFSGGIDSTVLLALVRDMYPRTPALFSNTGLEFPELVAFARSFDNVVEVRPSKPFHHVVAEYGWPVASKKVASMVEIVRENRPGRAASINLYLNGTNREGIKVPRWTIPAKWRLLLDAPFKVSARCCDFLKKDPFKKYEKAAKPGTITGQMATDSEQRRESYLRTGCNAFNAGRGPKSNPMSFWTKDDVWAFVRAHGLPYASVYDMGYSKTGCVFCGFGCHLDKTPNRFQLLKRTHPKLWEYVMHNLGMADVLSFIRVPVE